jgi:hypothetical protein
VPNDPLDTVVAVADRYDARYLVLDSTRPRTTDGLYSGEANHLRLELCHVTGEEEQSWQLYKITEQSGQ